ncbi:uncharacterized protein LOC144181013 isoform X2 [Stigmatopora nigra]
MKVTGTEKTTSIRRLAALAALFLIGCVRPGEAGTLSQVLDNRDTFQAAREVARHAQKSETEEDTRFKLIPHLDEDQIRDPMRRCCLRAGILDSYLKIFNLLNDWRDYPRMSQLYADLERLSLDLKKAQCVPLDQREDHAKQFDDKLKQMTREHGLNKALSEVDLLFMDLQDHCLPQTSP